MFSPSDDCLSDGASSQVPGGVPGTTAWKAHSPGFPLGETPALGPHCFLVWVPFALLQRMGKASYAEGVLLPGCSSLVHSESPGLPR